MYPQHCNLDSSSIEGHWLRKAREEYGVKLAPIQVQHFEGEHTWADSFTKLLAFNRTQYARVISLDSHANVLGHMDELFLLPRASIAMPRAYWLEEGLSSQIAVIEPSKYQFERILQAFRRRQESDFDMETSNDLYARDCVIIPHRMYDLLTGEFRKKDHHREAKYVHFSDWPYPKPWVPNSEVKRLELQPDCDGAETGERDCSDRRIWNKIYREYRERRQVSTYFAMFGSS
ncbi:nucleotide-diphospho-sugar transferase [Aureobasidium melanogenum CBS 110374]|uniref:Nucleotide-diphospho-sugar transferase n=1 Tax=Aureobasidium melanogenum (strain CBS 110374) TaxID=1043003 RepID=A0A074VJN2_AURM1|nr:nucleotide-diphospho-sugar transferase [Aureobasidium melanogenum CBS 110374]KEQ57827.1 nucleotide-diphospho-sugar transferase [Aureobasidium melanogenum CBS 110374]